MLASCSFCFPFKMAFEKSWVYSLIEGDESSLPGTGYVMRRGSEFESTIPMVGMVILAASTTLGCWLKPWSMVLRRITRSGSRVVVPNTTFELVNVPALHLRQCENSPHSSAVFSTVRMFGGVRVMKRMTPPR